MINRKKTPNKKLKLKNPSSNSLLILLKNIYIFHTSYIKSVLLHIYISVMAFFFFFFIFFSLFVYCKFVVLCLVLSMVFMVYVREFLFWRSACSQVCVVVRCFKESFVGEFSYVSSLPLPSPIFII